MTRRSVDDLPKDKKGRPIMPGTYAQELRWQLVMFKHFDLTPDRRAQVNFVRDEFAKLADFIVNELPPGKEALHAMRQLMEAKDTAVRAVVRDTIPHDRAGGPLLPS